MCHSCVDLDSDPEYIRDNPLTFNKVSFHPVRHFYRVTGRTCPREPRTTSIHETPGEELSSRIVSRPRYGIARWRAVRNRKVLLAGWNQVGCVRLPFGSPTEACSTQRDEDSARLLGLIELAATLDENERYILADGERDGQRSYNYRAYLHTHCANR